MACLRNESPSISSRSRLKPSLAFDKVRACRMRPGLGPRLLSESPVWDLCWQTLGSSKHCAVEILGAVAAQLQTEVVLLMWSEVLLVLHSSLGNGGLELGSLELWAGCTGTEVVFCIDSGLCSPIVLHWEHLQLSCRWRCSSWWPLSTQLTRAVPFIRFLVLPASSGLQEEWWLLGWVRELESGDSDSWCLQGLSPSPQQESAQDIKVLLSIDLFQPKSRFGYLTHKDRK